MHQSASNSAQRQRLHDDGEALYADGREDEALLKFHAAIAAEPEGAAGSYYNIGLIHKYRRQWRESFEANLRACALWPDNEAARWNLAIAATALRDWGSARRAWADHGIKLDGEGPVVADFGQTPVRLNPASSGEVVWARRIDPVRARIESVPLPDSGHCCGDVVLHDGASNGRRESGGQSYMVFDVLELFEPSALSTFELNIDLPDAQDAARLVDLLQQAGLHVEDWTASVKHFCRQCSEGEAHEHAPVAPDSAWQPARRIGIAATARATIDPVLRAWEAEGGASGILECVLDAAELEV